MKEKSENGIINSENLFTVVFADKNGRKGVKSPDGQVIVPARYDDIIYTYNYECLPFYPYVAMKEGKMGLVRPDGRGTELTPFVYDSIELIREVGSHLIYRKDGSSKFGLMRMNGQEVTPCRLDSYSCGIQTIFYSWGGYQGVWQTNIDVLVPPIYDDIRVEDDDLLLFTLNGEEGYVKTIDLSFVPMSSSEDMDCDEWHDLKNECLRDQYEIDD